MAPRPDLTVVIPTQGREALRDTLATIPPEPWLEVVVVADGPNAHGGAEPVVAGHPRTRLLQEDESCWGHPQRNLGMAEARGRWLAFIDDDDLYTEAAFPAIRAAMRGNKPTLFRMRYDWKPLTLWAEPAVAHCNVGTPMILTPNDPARLGVWPSKRTGDFDFIQDTVRGFGGCRFDETVIVTVRDLEGRYPRPAGD